MLQQEVGYDFVLPLRLYGDGADAYRAWAFKQHLNISQQQLIFATNLGRQKFEVFHLATVVGEESSTTRTRFLLHVCMQHEIEILGLCCQSEAVLHEQIVQL